MIQKVIAECDFDFLDGINPDFVTIIRYSSGNYYLKRDSKPLVRWSASDLDRFFPEALKQLRQKAGVREYAVS